MSETAQIPMPLLTPDQREHLLSNGRRPGDDHVPVVKFFNPVGIGRSQPRGHGLSYAPLRAVDIRYAAAGAEV